MRFTPTAIALPVLAAMLCWAGLPEDSTIVAVAGLTEPSSVRLSDDEIRALLRANATRFGVLSEDRTWACFAREPDIEFWFHCPGAIASARHPQFDRGSSSLRQAVTAHRKGVFRRVEKSFGEQLRWLEEEGPAAAVLKYTEDWSLEEISIGLVSLSCEGLWYLAGVHANVFYRTATFWDDGDSAREVDLEELFLSGVPWRQELIRLLSEQLREAGATDGVDKPSLECWRLASMGIGFFFSPGEVGSFGEGSFSPFIRYEALREFLDPAGPLGFLLR